MPGPVSETRIAPSSAFGVTSDAAATPDVGIGVAGADSLPQARTLARASEARIFPMLLMAAPFEPPRPQLSAAALWTGDTPGSRRRRSARCCCLAHRGSAAPRAPPARLPGDVCGGVDGHVHGVDPDPRARSTYTGGVHLDDGPDVRRLEVVAVVRRQQAGGHGARAVAPQDQGSRGAQVRPGQPGAPQLLSRGVELHP